MLFLKMPSQKNSKPRSEAHPDKCYSCCCMKKAHFKKVILCLAVAQVVGIFYLYHQYRASPTPKQETSPSHESVKEPSGKLGNIFHLPLTQAKDMSKYYVEVKENVWCLSTGTRSNKHQKGKCDCLDGWMGLDCGIPPAVWNSEFIAKGTAKGVQIRRRHHPRRVIYSLVYNGELDLLNSTLSYLGDLVEVFLIGEVNPSDNLKLKNEISPNVFNKVVYISLGSNSLSTGSYTNIQKEIWMKGKKVMSDFRPDDVVILTDMVSVPSKEVLTFLKLYEGFSEPIQFKLAATDSLHNTSVVLNLSTRSTLLSTEIMACTFEYLRYLCTYDASLVWSYDHVARKEESLNFQKNNWPIRQWTVGSVNFPAGLVCHFCIPIANITVLSQGTLEPNNTRVVVTKVLESNDTKAS